MYGMVGSGGDGGGGRSGSSPRRGQRQRVARGGGVGTTHQKQRPPRSLYRRLLAYIEQAWTGAKFGSDIELDILEQEPHYRPKDINILCRSTHFTRCELQLLYRSFKEHCPTGVVTEGVFKEMFFQMFPRGASASQYAHYVFSNLDKENTGVISFSDLIGLISSLHRGTLNERLRWIFSLYDLNGDGCITRQEMTSVVQAVYDLMGQDTDLPVGNCTVEHKVEALFAMFDINLDGVITLDEFTEVCSRDNTIVNNLDTILNPLSQFEPQFEPQCEHYEQLGTPITP